MIVVSPHLDDAVYSVGQVIAANPGTTVLTLFAGIPPEDVLTPYDASAGFASSAECVRARRAEDDQACEILGATTVHGPWLDGQYGQHLDVTAATEWLRAEIDRTEGPVLIPVGIQHPDHEATHAVGRGAAGERQVVLYEELPYRIQYPEATVGYLAQIGAPPINLGEGDLELKRAAVERYGSQVNDFMRRTVFVPERLWVLS